MNVCESDGTNIDLVIQSAYERHHQILLLAEHEAQSLKRTLVQKNKIEVDQQWYMDIEHFSNELCQEIFAEVEQILLKFSTSPSTVQQYKLFLLSSIVEGLVRMFEPNIYINILDRDKSILEEILPQCVSLYREFMNTHIGFQSPLHLQISNINHLQLRDPQKDGSLSKSKENVQSIGGVTLSDKSGNIVYKATLDCRVSILKEICLPLVKALIWGESLSNIYKK